MKNLLIVLIIISTSSTALADWIQYRSGYTIYYHTHHYHPDFGNAGWGSLVPTYRPPIYQYQTQYKYYPGTGWISNQASDRQKRMEAHHNSWRY